VSMEGNKIKVCTGGGLKLWLCVNYVCFKHSYKHNAIIINVP